MSVERPTHTAEQAIGAASGAARLIVRDLLAVIRDGKRLDLARCQRIVDTHTEHADPRVTLAFLAAHHAALSTDPGAAWVHSEVKRALRDLTAAAWRELRRAERAADLLGDHDG